MFILRALCFSAASLIFLFAISKMLGNKQISQLNLFDYINGITIGSIAAEMALSDTFKELLFSAAAMLVYGLSGLAISKLTIGSITARRIFSGEPVVLAGDGKIYPDSLKKARLDIDDLLTAARCAGYYSFDDVAFAVIESNGQISFCPKQASKPVSLSDLGQQPEQPPQPVSLIQDGVIMQKNLDTAGISARQLSDIMHAKGYRSPEEIFLAIYQDGRISFYPKTSGVRKLEEYR